MQEPPHTPTQPVLRFDRPLVMVGGGGAEPDLIRHLAGRGAALVGADGGADAIAAAGLAPDAIVGDFDSLARPADWEGRTRLIRIAEQQTTDFEKCLYSTVAPVTIGLGLFGGRFDHTLAAIEAAGRHAAARRIVLVGEVDLVLAVSGGFGFSVEAGERVSVHPLERLTFAGSRGLLYPLKGLRLGPGLGTGTSNIATEGAFEIRVARNEQAPWLLIVDRRHLDRLVATLLEPFPS